MNLFFFSKIRFYFMTTSKCINSTAGYFGIPRSYVGQIINPYKKHNIR